jgi:F1F0 ATPase subunit 2
MHEAVTWSLAAVAGALLGGVFFGGLWWTIRRGLASPRPALWFGFSLPVRLILVVAGFRLVGGDDVARLLACLAGFVVGRLVVGRLTRPAPGDGDLAPRTEDAPCGSVPTS